MSARRNKRTRSFMHSGRHAPRARYTGQYSTSSTRGAAGPRNLGGARTGGKRRQNVRTAGFLGIEHKFYDTSLEEATIAAPADASGGMVNPSATVLISSVPQGDDASTRDGKRCMIESVQIQGNIKMVSQSGLSILDINPSFFIALVQDTQTNAAAMDSQQAFVNPANHATLACSPLKNLLSGNRFITHKVWQFTAPMPGVTANDTTDVLIMGQNIPFSFFKKLSMVVDFNGGTTNVVGNVVNNSLHLIAYTNDSSWNATISYNARVRFVG